MNQDLDKGFKFSPLYISLLLIVLILIFLIFRAGEPIPSDTSLVLDEEEPSVLPEIETIEDLVNRKAAFSKDDFLRIIEEDYPIETELPITSLGHDINGGGDIFINFFSYLVDSKERVEEDWDLYAKENRLKKSNSKVSYYDLFYESEKGFSIGIWFDYIGSLEKTSVSVELL